jgi:hypothetical protein
MSGAVADEDEGIELPVKFQSNLRDRGWRKAATPNTRISLNHALPTKGGDPWKRGSPQSHPGGRRFQPPRSTSKRPAFTALCPFAFLAGDSTDHKCAVVKFWSNLSNAWPCRSLHDPSLKGATTLSACRGWRASVCPVGRSNGAALGSPTTCQKRAKPAAPCRRAVHSDS